MPVGMELGLVTNLESIVIFRVVFRTDRPGTDILNLQPECDLQTLHEAIKPVRAPGRYSLNGAIIKVPDVACQSEFRGDPPGSRPKTHPLHPSHKLETPTLHRHPSSPPPGHDAPLA